MRRLFGIVILLLVGAFASCSDGGDDSVVRACKVIVETCHRGPSVGSCLDSLGPLASDCIGCIGSHQCDYSACQADVPGCRIPSSLLDPGDRIDVGSRPPDAGSYASDSGSGG